MEYYLEWMDATNVWDNDWFPFAVPLNHKHASRLLMDTLKDEIVAATTCAVVNQYREFPELVMAAGSCHRSSFASRTMDRG